MTDFEHLYDGIDQRVLLKLVPDRSGWVEMPDVWKKKFKDAVSNGQWKESPSSIVSYIQCPMKWLLERYIIEDDSQEVSYYALLGSIVHRILEVFYNEPNGKRSNKRLKKIEKNLWLELENGTRTGIADLALLEEWQLYVLQQTEGEFGAKRDYSDVLGQMKWEVSMRIENLYEVDPEPNLISVVSNETWTRTSKNGIRVNGKIDRIALDEETNLEIIQDYKTGKTPFGNPDVDILENAFIPCGLYALMRSTVSSTLKESGVVQSVELLYLKEGTVYEIPIDKEEIDIADNLLEGVTREMKYSLENGEIKLCPEESSETNHCRFCPVSGLCPAFSESRFGEMEEEFPEIFELSSEENDD